MKAVDSGPATRKRDCYDALTAFSWMEDKYEDKYDLAIIE